MGEPHPCRDPHSHKSRYGNIKASKEEKRQVTKSKKKQGNPVIIVYPYLIQRSCLDQFLIVIIYRKKMLQ